MSTIAVLGTLDSKGHEHAFIADLIRARGHTPLLIDAGCLEAPQVMPDVARTEICAGIADLPQDRGQRVAAMAAALPDFIAALAASGRIQGIISLGGGGGTAIATSAMRALPIGFPKLMVSTLASGNTAPYLGTKDITMMPAIVDVAGLNRISREIFTNAAGAVCGMVEMAAGRSKVQRGHTAEDFKTRLSALPETIKSRALDYLSDASSAGAGADSPPVQSSDAEGTVKPLIVASMFGNTTACVNEAKRIVEEAGYEVLVFHATGTGGRIMESLIESGMVAGVLDITTTEWADEYVGGILGAGPSRLGAAAKAGVPAIITPGCLDMVNFGEPQTVPEKFSGRTFYHHNPQVTLMRTTPEECAELGRIIAEKANSYTGPVTVLLPLRGISIISAEGGPFHDAAADKALFDAIRAHLKPEVPVVEMDCAINDPQFALACAKKLLEQMPAAAGA